MSEAKPIRRAQTTAGRIVTLEEAVEGLTRLIAGINTASLSELPESAREPVALLRAWILDERRRVQVRDLVDEVTKDTIARVSAPDLTAQGIPFGDELLKKRVDEFQQATLVLAYLFSEAGYWGAPEADRVWARALQRVANAVEGGSGLVVWLRLRLLPALIVLYTGCVAAVANKQYGSVRCLLFDPIVKEPSRDQPVVLALFPSAVMEPDVAHRLPGLDRHHTPVSDWLWEVLRPILQAVIPDPDQLEQAFDEFEYLLGVAYASKVDRNWAPIGRFAWRGRQYPEGGLATRLARQFEEEGERWSPFSAGLVGGDLETARANVASYNAWVARASLAWF